MPPPQPDLTPSVGALAVRLAELPGAIAVALGGSRATATHRPDSDWDLAVYYRASRRPLEPEDLRRLGHSSYVSELGEWGPTMNGGGWLTVGDTAVDVLYRDLDTIEHWMEDAEKGRFQVLNQNGHVVGAPTYLPVGELALCLPIAGELPRPRFPEALATAASRHWDGRAQVALMFAGSHARAADAVGCAGMLAGAVLCTAHARVCERREWVLTEKLLVERAGLGETHALLAQPGRTAAELGGTVGRVSAALEVEPLKIR